MKYVSTRNCLVEISSAQAITRGISQDGGLFVPQYFPRITQADIRKLLKLDYVGRAKAILSLFLTDFSADEIDRCVGKAYNSANFSSPEIAPLVNLGDGVNILELWKGPTCAFKDMALQILPRLMTVSAKKAAEDTQIVILVATSGDTGKAALEGFKDVENTKILVFYPNDGVSPMQKLQMCTQEGKNVGVCAIEGNFDDAQNGVKQIFTDKRIADILASNSMAFSSANSINWGRLVPQVVYYISAYCDMINSGQVEFGKKVNFVVPTGNFGNILAAYYAKRMEIPINKLICASNSNSVLTEFLTTGVYDRNRDFYTTISPSMDILISSNLERLLYSISSSGKVVEWMHSLAKSGRYDIGPRLLGKIRRAFDAGCCNDEETKQTINKLFKEKNYLCDTHTAVAVKVYNDYRERTGDATPTVIASTANPFKFSRAVLEAVEGSVEGLDEFQMVERLAQVTGKSCPAQLANLRGKPVRFTDCCGKDSSSMEKVVMDMLGID